MLYKHFRTAVITRVTIIVLLSILLAFVIVKKPMLFVILTITFLITWLVINLIRYIEQTNKDLTHFLLSIRQSNFTEYYSLKNQGKHQQQLSKALNNIVNEFAKLNEQKELHYQFLQTLNENINVAILSFDERDDLITMNTAAKRMLELPYFSKVEHFKNISHDLHTAVVTMQPESRCVVKVILKYKELQLSVQTKEIVLQGKTVKIILLQNISNELETKELEAWHQLIRVLTHEIMNSITPIASLSAAVESILKQKLENRSGLDSLTSENVDDVLKSLDTIQTRSHGLLKFVTSYKEFARPLHATYETVDLASLVKRIIILLEPEFDSRQINIKCEISVREANVNADVSLLEQVVINLLKNAMEAVPHDGTGEVTVRLAKQGTRLAIYVEDNGTSIDEELLPKIFVPFFTTKPDGSGIGLSLSRQIMKLHNGSINVKTGTKGSTFILEF